MEHPGPRELSASTAPHHAGRRRGTRGLVVTALLVAAVAVAAALSVRPRIQAAEALKKETAELNTPTVSVVTPKPGGAQIELVLPGTMQPHASAAVHSRTNGYVKRWTADIGTAVKTGEVLAELDTPEIDAQLQQARADLNTAEAHRRIAETTARRWQELLATGTVTRQDADQVQSQLQAREAAAHSARAQVLRLEKLQSFKRVTAPFDGVVTARNAEVGALVEAGTSRELFHVAATHRLRVFVNVPQAHARDVKPGMVAELYLSEQPGAKLEGRLARTSRSIDPVSGSLTAEIEVANPGGELLSGAYVQVRLPLKGTTSSLVIPVNTLLFRGEGVQVAVAGPDRKVRLKTLKLGRDFGTTVEVASGLDPADAVVLNPADSLAAGAMVRVVAAPEPKKKP